MMIHQQPPPNPLLLHIISFLLMIFTPGLQALIYHIHLEEIGSYVDGFSSASRFCLSR